MRREGGPRRGHTKRPAGREFDDNPTGRWALVDLEGDQVKDGFVFAKFVEPVTA
jgi:hypothetical protein